MFHLRLVHNFKQGEHCQILSVRSRYTLSLAKLTWLLQSWLLLVALGNWSSMTNHCAQATHLTMNHSNIRLKCLLTRAVTPCSCQFLAGMFQAGQPLQRPKTARFQPECLNLVAQPSFEVSSLDQSHFQAPKAGREPGINASCSSSATISGQADRRSLASCDPSGRLLSSVRSGPSFLLGLHRGNGLNFGHVLGNPR